MELDAKAQYDFVKMNKLTYNQLRDDIIVKNWETLQRQFADYYDKVCKSGFNIAGACIEIFISTHRSAKYKMNTETSNRTQTMRPSR
jgi:hypothetical protein